MAQDVKALATKPDNLSFIPEPCMTTNTLSSDFSTRATDTEKEKKTHLGRLGV